MRPIAGSEDRFPNRRKSTAPSEAMRIVRHLLKHDDT